MLHYIEEMDPDDATDLLKISETNQIRAQQIINALPKKKNLKLKTYYLIRKLCRSLNDIYSFNYP